MIKEVINKLNDGIYPDKTEIVETFDEIFTGVADDVLSVSFISLFSNFIKTLNDSSEVVACAVKSANNAIGSINTGMPAGSIMLTNETINQDMFSHITFARDVILAANDIPVVRFEQDNPFEENNYIKLIKGFNIFPKRKSINGFFNTDEFEREKFCCFLLDETEKYFKYTTNISNRLCFKNILNLINNMLNPVNAKNIILGVDKIENVEKYAKLCLEAGYINSLVVSSGEGVPIISPEGESYVAEAWKNKIFAYKLSPELVGFKEHSISDIKFNSLEETKDILNELFENKLTGSAFYDTVIMNSAFALYIIKKTESIVDGVALAKATIEKGIAQNKIISIKKS